MRKFTLTILAAVVCALMPLANRAEEKPSVKLGVQVGNYLPGPFHPYNVTGDVNKDKHHSLVCEHGLNPMVIIFAREAPEAGQPVADLLAQLESAVAKHHAKTRLGGFAVFLNEGNADALKTKLQNLAGVKDRELKNVTLAIDNPEGDSGLKSYALDKNADAIVLLVNRHQVVANHTYVKDKLTADDVKKIMGEVEQKLVGGRRSS
jgi:hypothetical protein